MELGKPVEGQGTLGWAHLPGGWEKKMALASPGLWGGGRHSCESIHPLSYFLPCFSMECSTCSYLTISCLQASCASKLQDSRQQPMDRPDLLEASGVGTMLSYRVPIFPFRMLN